MARFLSNLWTVSAPYGASFFLWMVPPSWLHHGRIQKSYEWADNFNDDGISDENAKLLLAHAAERYKIAENSISRLNERAHSFAKLQLTLIGAIIASVKVFQLHPNACVWVSALAILVAMVISLLALRPFTKGTIPTIPDMTEAYRVHQNVELMQARTYHLVVTRLTIHADWQASHLFASLALLVIGVLFAIIGLLTATPLESFPVGPADTPR